MFHIRLKKILFFVLILTALSACQSAAEIPEPELVAEATAVPTNTAVPPTPTITATATDLPSPVVLPTNTVPPTDTPVPTEEPTETAEPTATETETPAPTETPVPTSPPQAATTPTSPPPPPPQPTSPPEQPQYGPNLLPNPSFENGYTNLYGAPELQVPVGWYMEIDEGGILAPESGVAYLRPESRIAPRWGIPPDEVNLFVYNGDWTLKVFKGGAPISFRMFTDVHLEPGTYRFVASYFPDIVAHYNTDGSKVWAPQALAGEAYFINTGRGVIWTPMQVGTKNTMVETFTVSAPGTIRVGVGWRARYVQGNNGLFIDDWYLQKVN